MMSAQSSPSGNVVPLPTSRSDQRRSAALWTGTIIDRGYSIVPTILLWGQAKLGLTPDEMNVLLQLISHRWTAGSDPHPGKDLIATRMGREPRTVQRHIAALERRGFVRRVKRVRHHKGQDTNGYDLGGLIEKLEALAPEFKKVSEQNKLRRMKVEKPSP
jgi:predicted transcriptional regulator